MKTNRQSLFDKYHLRLFRSIKLLPLLLIILALHSNISAQNKLFNFNFSNKTIKDAITNIEQNSTYKFFFNGNLSNLDEPTSVKIDNATIEETLNKLLDGSNITYKILDHNMIILTRKTSNGKEGALPLVGTVCDAKTGEPLIGVGIMIAGTSTGTVTDMDGKFTLNGVNKNSILNISYVGYQPQKLTIGDQTSLLVKLNPDLLSLSEVVVVGNVNEKSKLNSSISVSTVGLKDMEMEAPRSTPDLLRDIPGIKVENSGGDGNTNISVRGVPITTGGSKYLQLQEDGLPLIQFGDIAFATSDMFLRADLTVSRIEAIRGGSASTMGTNSPAGIVNFISNTGSQKGGAISLSTGLNYNDYRTDFNYGGPITNGLNFDIGGFYRTGTGPRTTGFSGNQGGQLKFNLTKMLGDKGFIRFYFKHLDDRATSYMPMPIQVTGTNSNPVYTSLPGFDIKRGALQSPYLMQDFGIGENGEPQRTNVSDGMHPQSSYEDIEFHYDLGNGFRIEDNARVSQNSGDFVSPYPANVGSTSSILSEIGSATGWNLQGASLTYANTGVAYTGANAMDLIMFDVKLNNFNSFFNDFRLKKTFKGGGATFGFYKSNQHVGMSWLWNSYITDVLGNGLHPLNITNASGTVMNPGGEYAYGTPLWGNLCRNYNTDYDISAPYGDVTYNFSKNFNVDASLRWDIGKVTGTYTGGTSSTKDMNGDGIIEPNEVNVESINYADTKVVNYSYNYASYSIGLNYLLGESKAVFARYSVGASTPADRILFTSNILPDGSAKGVKDQLDQAEFGFKGNFENFGIFLTGFYARVKEQAEYEATTQRIIQNDYKSYGLELEFAYSIMKSLEIKGGATYTKAQISSGTNVGNMPRRQAPFIFNLLPIYTINKLNIGLNIIGTSYSYAQDDNLLKLPGYVLVNPFVSFQFSKVISLSVDVNNLFNALGITEADGPDAIVNNTTNIIEVRPVTGRTLEAKITMNF
jgi:outer membrane receptor protein involved in Fe transport